MMECDLFFMPKRDERTGEAVLMPTLISDDGKNRLVANKHVETAEVALAMYSGFTLALAIDAAGGLEALKAEVEARDEELANDG